MTPRRNFLKALGAVPVAVKVALARAVVGLPGGSAASVPATFDFFISTTGSDTNAGTLASPWAITAINTKQATYAGKRVGLLPGTYDISSRMNATFHTPALNINGGPNSSTRTYIGSSDLSGNESPRSATLDAKGASGFYGGGNSNISSMMGQGFETNVPANKGNFTISGLVFTGFSLWAVHIGNYDGATATVSNWTVQNCIFTGGVGTNLTSAVGNGTNLGPIIVFAGANGLVTNNYFHDNVGYYTFDTQHFSAVYQWGLGPTATHDNTYTFNTIVNSGNFQGKEANQYNTEIAYNLIDMTGTAATQDVCGSPIFGFMSDSAGVGTGSKFHHNVCKHRGSGISVQNTNTASAYTKSPASIYNNTLIAIDNQASADLIGGYINTGAGGITGQLSAYNNLFYDNGVLKDTYGYVMTAIDIFALSDFNIYGGWNLWGSVPDSATGSTPLTTYTSLAAFQTAFGKDANSITSTSNPFTGVNTGLLASAYQLSAGYAHRNFGRVGGVIGGAVCDVGAWDGTVTQIGCNFA